MTAFDFDKQWARTGTGSVKWDGQRRFLGRDGVLPLWVADMDFAVPDAVAEALRARAEHPIYGYTVQPDRLCQTVVDWMRRRHGLAIEPGSVLIAPGVVPSLHAAVLAFTEPGDGVVVQPPVYPPFFGAVTATGRRLMENPLRLGARGYEMDLEQLDACAKQGAKLLILCSPHNPVGRVWSQGELRAVLDIAERSGMRVIADEIHHDLVFSGARHLPLAGLAPDCELVVTALAPSKTFNIPGLGISALIAQPAQRDALLRAFSLLHMSAHNPFSLAAFEAAYGQGAAWLDALLVYLEETRDQVLERVSAWRGVRAYRPEGTYLVWLDFGGIAGTDRELQHTLLERARVGLSPGTMFGRGGEGHMRLNLGSPRAHVMEGLARIESALELAP